MDQMDCSMSIDDDDQSNDGQPQMPVAHLEDEFRRVLALTTNSDQPNPSISTTISTSTTDTVSNEFMDEDFADHNSGIPIEAVQQLQILAKTMNSVGTLQFCISLYASVRKPFLEASFRKLVVQTLSPRAVRKSDWEVLEKMIKDWIWAAKICFRVLFVREKWLCDQIVDGLGRTDISDACFAETIKACATHLFGFAEAVTYFSPAPQKLFRVLDLYRMVSVLSPQMNLLFLCHSLESVLREIIGEDYLKKMTGKFYQAIADYVKLTSEMVKHCLRNEGLLGIGIFSSRISKSALRDRFSTFNTLFEEVQQNLGPIVVPDLQIRDDLRKSILDAFIPAYIPFLERYRKLIESTNQSETYIKYSAAELASAILVFFRETTNEEAMPSPKPTTQTTHTQIQPQMLEQS